MANYLIVAHYDDGYPTQVTETPDGTLDDAIEWMLDLHDHADPEVALMELVEYRPLYSSPVVGDFPPVR